MSVPLAHAHPLGWLIHSLPPTFKCSHASRGHFTSPARDCLLLDSLSFNLGDVSVLFVQWCSRAKAFSFFLWNVTVLTDYISVNGALLNVCGDVAAFCLSWDGFYSNCWLKNSFSTRNVWWMCCHENIGARMFFYTLLQVRHSNVIEECLLRERNRKMWP